MSGQGRGHTSRVIAISDELRRCGHEVLFCCGGTAQEILASQGEEVIAVPALRQVMEGNEVRHGQTIRSNLKAILRMPALLSRLADTFTDYHPDLLITDFEAFSPRAARRIGLPVLSFNHQQVVTETEYELPPGCWLQAKVTATAIRFIAPKDPAHILLTSFFYPSLKNPDRTTLVPPIIRPAVQQLAPTRGEHILVYYNQAEGAEHVLDALRQVSAPFIIYNFPEPEEPEAYPNLQFKQPSLETFLDDLATSRAVICTAGFTLTSEALYLGKPLLVVPNRGIFEQTINAFFLEREELGMAVMDRALTAADVEALLRSCSRFEARLRDRPACGNKQAVACIERVLSEVSPSLHACPPLPYDVVTQASVDASIAKPE